MKDLRQLERYRVRGRAVVELWGWEGDETCGAFTVPSPIDQAPMTVIASSGGGWDHVSISRKNRTPNWAEMEHIARLFFRDDETAMQLHVPARDHVNMHPNCLHWWRPQNQEIPRPPSIFVGIGNQPARNLEEALERLKAVTPVNRPNTPPPDELAAVREQIRALESREAELRALLIAEPDVREGANWLAEVKTVVTQRTDLKEMRACHPVLVDEFTYPIETTRVVLSGITEDGELVSARAMRSAEKSGDTQ